MKCEQEKILSEFSVVAFMRCQNGRNRKNTDRLGFERCRPTWCERNTRLCVLKASLLSLPSAFVSSRGQHWVVAAPASSQPAASVPRRQEPAAAVGRPHPECRTRPAAAQGQRSAQPPLHLRPQVWVGPGVIGHEGCEDIDFCFCQLKVPSWFYLNARQSLKSRKCPIGLLLMYYYNQCMTVKTIQVD